MQNKPEVVDYFNQVIKDFEALNPDIQVIQDFNEGNFVPGLVRNDPPDVVTRGFAQATADFVKKGIFADLADLPAAVHHQPEDAGAHQLLGPVQRQRDQRPAVLAWLRPGSSTTGTSSTPTAWPYPPPGTNSWRPAKPSRRPESPRFTGPTRTPGPWRRACSTTSPAARSTSPNSSRSSMATGADISTAAPESFTNNFGPALPKMLQLASYAQNGAASKNYADGNAAFAKGQAAMYLQGPWALSQLVAANPGDPAGHLPAARDQQPGGDQGPGQRGHGALHHPEHPEHGSGAAVRQLPAGAGRGEHLQRKERRLLPAQGRPRRRPTRRSAGSTTPSRKPVTSRAPSRTSRRRCR